MGPECNCGFKSNTDGMAEQKMKEMDSITNMPDEFAGIYEKYYEDIFRYIYREIPHRQMAEDITQDVFYVALKKGEDFLTHSEPKLWLLRTAWFKMREFHRRMKCWAVEALDEEHWELSVEESCFEEIELELTALAILSEKEWTLIKRYYFGGCPISVLAEEEGITENNMRVRLHRMKKKLKDKMK